MSFELTASFHKGIGHIGHNNRTIAVPHSDKTRQHLNVCHTSIPIEEAYEILFGQALEEYNRGKKPSRQIKNYYKHIIALYRKGEEKLQQAISSGASRKEQAKIRSTYQKPFSEVIVSVGNKDAYNGSFACGGKNEELAVEVLNEYMANFQKRNPHLYVFNAVLHRDELGVPHYHINYIAWTNAKSKRGLSVRLSEHGAFHDMGLGDETEYGTIAFQRREREILTEIAKEHGINIVEGKHGKKHLAKEEYILEQEKEKSRKDLEMVEEQAGEVLKHQDDLIDFIASRENGRAIFEYIENQTLHKAVSDYEEAKQRTASILSSYWNEFNSSTSDYFAEYRHQKEILFGELQRARENANINRKRLKALLRDIAYGNDFFIIKLFKLAFALFVAVGSSSAEHEVRRLEEANRQIKSISKKVMSDSKSVGDVLRTCEVEEIENVLKTYEKQLQQSIDAIKATVIQKDNVLEEER